MTTYNSDSNSFQEEKRKVSGKHILTLVLWLALMPPLGLWKLWRDDALSTTAKWRILIYLFFIPAVLYVTLDIWMVNRTLQRLLP